MAVQFLFAPTYDAKEKRLIIDPFKDLKGIKIEDQKILIWLKKIASFFGIGGGNFLVKDPNGQGCNINVNSLRKWIQANDPTLNSKLLNTHQALIDKVNYIYTRKKAEDNDPIALYSLGTLHELGIGTPTSIPLAAINYKLAVLKGNHPLSQFKLAAFYEKGYGPVTSAAEADQLYKSAFPELKKLANEDAAAQTALGIMYLQGKGVDRSDAEAFKLFQKAAESGHIEANFYLGQCYQEGLGVVISAEKAIKCHLKNAKKGYPPSQLALGKAYLNEFNRLRSEKRHFKAGSCVGNAHKWLEKARSQGEKSVSLELGFLELSKGSIKSAVNNFTMAFDEGLVEGAFYNGQLFDEHFCYSIKLDMNYEAAKKEVFNWYGRAADKGHGPSQVELARQKSLRAPAEAIALLNQAIQNSYTPALFELGCILMNHETFENGFVYFKLAAEQGDVAAMEILADTYRDGIGDIAKSETEFAYWDLRAKYAGSTTESGGAKNIKIKLMEAFAFLQNPEEITFSELSKLIDSKLKSLNPKFDVRKSWNKTLLTEAEKKFIQELQRLFGSKLSDRAALCKLADEKLST